MAPGSPQVDAKTRLQEEVKAWGKSHPVGFKAAPRKGTVEDDLFVWDCVIPGKSKTPWEGGLYRVRLEIPQNYPFAPPLCVFDPPLFHPNVYPSGKVSLSLLDNWRPQITLKEILLGIQILLDDPNFDDPAQMEAFVIHSQGKHLYKNKVLEQAKKMSAS